MSTNFGSQTVSPNKIKREIAQHVRRLLGGGTVNVLLRHGSWKVWATMDANLSKRSTWNQLCEHRELPELLQLVRRIDKINVDQHDRMRLFLSEDVS